jgi:hypothetical protein
VLAVLAAAASVTAAAPGESAVGRSSRDVPRPAAADAQDLPTRVPLVTLYLYDVHELLDPVFAALAAETNAIFKDMGVEVAWKNGGLGTTYGGGPSREIPIIVLKQPPGGHRAKANVLGFVPKHQPGAVWVFVDNVRGALGLTETAAQPSSARRLATALGRVIAHEVVHTLAPQLPHTRHGLMRDTLDNLDLTGPVRPAHDECREVVREALRIGPPSLPPATAATLPFPPRY